MLTADFDYQLPAERIAQQASARGQSRLLVVDAEGDDRHRRIDDLPHLLRRGDLLVVNNTRVIPARLFAHRDSGGRVEILLVERSAASEWSVLLKPARRARAGTRLTVDDGPSLEVIERLGDGRHQVRFSSPIEPHLGRLGHVPLPPYIRRPDAAADRERYQTVYAKVDGAIAAPTAGLHFTAALLDRLRAAGIGVAEITLHVGICTFKPVTAELVHEHRMEGERYELPAPAIAALDRTRRAAGRVVAVGTTVVRALEAAAAEGELRHGPARTNLFITPGFRFRAVDLLLTNFHLPRSTLLMLVSAFAGRERVLAAYCEAIAKRYRFYSYGDAMLLARRD